MKIKDMSGFSESSPEDEMKQFVISLMREFKLDEGHVLPQKPLLFRSMNLNPKQKDALPGALEALQKDGILVNGLNGLALTKHSKDVIY